MKNKLLAIICAFMLIFPLSLSTSFASDKDAFVDVFADQTNTVSEYEMLMEDASREDISPEESNALITSYKEKFSERSSNSPEILKQMGYTEEQIIAMKEYLEGNMTFEEAARIASATLTSTLSCPIHTTSKYIVSYSWTWNAVPSYTQRDSTALIMIPINSSGVAMTGTNTNDIGVIYYYKTTGTLDSSVYISTSDGSMEKDHEKLISYFDMMTTNGQDIIWAKSGYITKTIVPTSQTASFDTLRAKGCYGHSQSTSYPVVSVGITIMMASISLSFNLSNGALATKLGEKQYLFYLNGSYNVES